jgi:hypothetical protein
MCAFVAFSKEMSELVGITPNTKLLQSDALTFAHKTETITFIHPFDGGKIDIICLFRSQIVSKLTAVTNTLRNFHRQYTESLQSLTLLDEPKIVRSFDHCRFGNDLGSQHRHNH